jgi:hypothetical protein
MISSEAALTLVVVKFLVIVGSAFAIVLLLAVLGAKRDAFPSLRQKVTALRFVRQSSYSPAIAGHDATDQVRSHGQEGPEAGRTNRVPVLIRQTDATEHEPLARSG